MPSPSPSPSSSRGRLAAASLAIVLSLVVFASACGKGKGKGHGDGTGHGDHGGGGQGASIASAARPVGVFVDGKQLATSVDVGAEPRALAELVAGLPPIEGWLALEIVDASGKVHTTMAPAQNQPGKVPALAAGAAGLELGFRTPGATGALVDPVRGVTRLTIKAKGDSGQIAAQVAGGDHGSGDSGGQREHADEPRPAVSADLSIEITGAAGDSVFTGDRFESLPVIKAPSGDTETPGWNLLDVLAAAGVKSPQLVHLTDGEGATLQLEAADFDPARTVLYLKLNRSGVLRFRVFRKTGDTWDVGGELRGITKIHVVK